ncbi:MAG: YciI family protein [Pseudomonadota bacterium]
MFAVLFEDVEAGADIRAAHMPAHLRFLEENAGMIQSAGPLLDEAGQLSSGLWLVEAGAFAEVENLVHADPFWAAGLRKSVSIRRWRRVFVDGRRA